ncbi:MAG: bifunctional adenosylcobinamide kinase/adenosylcobinamide-phosphate guanylyltransferase [Thermoleophilia bacterium]|nr:bifunctional adenosylcobinamide kinase/adenosylcobinamide-phosphate guanylyltransferase [Thermoleophilia bacterium]
MIFITGGARSGKSSLAERLAREHGGRVTYIATARAGDAEMGDRIAGHRRRRPREWQTVEAYDDLPGAVEAALAGGGTVLVDCLTVYISNLLLSQGPGSGMRLEKLVDGEMERLAGLCVSRSEGNGRVILVSNEVGMGIVPDNALARVFRDLAGRANQKLAAVADEVYLCVSGLPVRVK